MISLSAEALTLMTDCVDMSPTADVVIMTANAMSDVSTSLVTARQTVRLSQSQTSVENESEVECMSPILIDEDHSRLVDVDDLSPYADVEELNYR